MALLLFCLFVLSSVTFSFPHSFGDPFSPLGSWHRRGPPCGLPPFITRLPEEAAERVKAIWKDYKEGDDCLQRQKLTRIVIHSLPEDVREKVFAGRCGPIFLRGVSPTVRREFKHVWFDHKMSLESKELALKKLAFSLLSGEALELFKKWDNELQERKAELERNIEALSPASKNALEEWRAIRQEERDFLARLPKEVKEELKTLCGCWPKLAITTGASTFAPPTTPASADAETTTVMEIAEREFAHFLDFVLPEEMNNDSHCSFYV